MVDPTLLADLRALALALAIGLLLGVQRGWTERTAEPGTRVAGIRTFGLIGLIGGVGGVLGARWGVWLPAATVLAVAALLGLGYWMEAQREQSVSATGAITGLLTVVLGVAAASGLAWPAAAAGVVAALLLSRRAVLHRWVASLSETELRAGLRFLLIAVVVLPLLPNRPMGPYGALNPFALGSVVVLLAGLSFAGYWAVKLLGPSRGLLATAAAGGLASSTAVTLAMARLARQHPGQARILAGAIVMASLVMVGRVLLLAALLAPELLRHLAGPLGSAGALGALLLWLSVRQHDTAVPAAGLELANPFELRPALLMTGLLALLLVASHAARAAFGGSGLFALAMLTGLVDVDAVIASMGRLVAGGLSPRDGAVAIALAVSVNMLVKAALPAVVGATAVRAPAAAMLLAMTLAGAAGWAVQQALS
jgi:uncharacterized membrane protein (DUF4010 family)